MVPEFFQRVLEESFGDIEGVSVYFDDVLIATKNEKEHDQIFNKVIESAKKLNIKFNPDKMQYKVNKVKFLGHEFSKEGMKPDAERIKALEAIKNPTNVKELQRILGMLNYLRRFIPNYSEITGPLYELLKKDVQLYG